jgi:hypothetical protein
MWNEETIYGFESKEEKKYWKLYLTFNTLQRTHDDEEEESVSQLCCINLNELLI